jgi:hypothetical protein
MHMTQMRRPWTYEEVAKLLSMAAEGPRTIDLFPNGPASATDVRSRVSGLDLPGWERGHRYRCWCCVEVRCTCWSTM